MIQVATQIHTINLGHIMKFFITYYYVINQTHNHYYEHLVSTGFDLDTEDGVRKIIDHLNKKHNQSVTLLFYNKLKD